MIHHLDNATTITGGGAERHMIEVTSLHRPDLEWRFTDAAGHEHAWTDGRGRPPVGEYRGSITYKLPSLIQVADPSEFTEEGEEILCWHYACAQCGETIEPGYRADDTQQFIAGLMRPHAITFTIPAKHRNEIDAYIAALFKGEPIDLFLPAGMGSVRSS